MDKSIVLGFKSKYLRAEILSYDKTNGAASKTAAGTSQYAQWVARTAERKKEHEEMIATVARTDPAGAAKRARRGPGQRLRPLLHAGRGLL